MSSVPSYVVSVGDILAEPWFPDDETYVECVDGCTWHEQKDPDKPDLAEWFSQDVNSRLPAEFNGRCTTKVMVDGTVKAVLPKGFCRACVEKELKALKQCAEKMTLEDLLYTTCNAYHVHEILRYCTAFESVVVTIDSSGTEDVDSLHRWLRYLVEDNDKADTEVFVYGYGRLG